MASPQGQESASFSQQVRDNTNLIQNTSGIIAALGLDKIGRGSVGNLITPATWVLNYGAQGSTPSAVDVGIYGSGFISGIAGMAVSTLKAIVDDDINQKVQAIRLQQLAKYRPYILPVQSYGSSSPFIIAQTIASNGGTAWQGQNGQWVYLTDAKGRLVIDFEPQSALRVMRPKYPFERASNGKFIYCSTSC
ncbi:hypothetical protein ACFOEK_14670 [Litoribrevibacter euphylliae]|uniref:Uncharacterized protein n=1 Tax=Litoribrevibacter euphylliae TaxID=1834034 RepID=A0ABV7HL81_9GAMM